MSTAHNGPQLTLKDPNGDERLALAAMPNGTSLFTAGDIGGTGRALLMGIAGGHPNVTLMTKRTTMRATFTVGDDDAPGILLLDASVRLRALFGLKGDGTPTLVLHKEQP